MPQMSETVTLPELSLSSMAKAFMTMPLRRSVRPSLIKKALQSRSLLEQSYLPESGEELFVADLSVTVDVVVLHESLELDLLGEESI
jgi:hypothetical protein